MGLLLRWRNKRGVVGYIMDWEARESRPKWKMGRERKEKREQASAGPKGGGGPTRLLRLDWAEKLFEIEF
jgi:hypothetical protein